MRLLRSRGPPATLGQPALPIQAQRLARSSCISYLAANLIPGGETYRPETPPRWVLAVLRCPPYSTDVQGVAPRSRCRAYVDLARQQQRRAIPHENDPQQSDLLQRARNSRDIHCPRRSAGFGACQEPSRHKQLKTKPRLGSRSRKAYHRHEYQPGGAGNGDIGDQFAATANTATTADSTTAPDMASSLTPSDAFRLVGASGQPPFMDGTVNRPPTAGSFSKWSISTRTARASFIAN